MLFRSHVGTSSPAKPLTKAQCEEGAEPSEEDDAVQESQELVLDSMEEPALGKMKLLWRDCGLNGKLVNFTTITPSKLHIGRTTRIHASGQLSRAVTAANLTVKMAAGIAGLELVDRQLRLAGPRVRSVSTLNQTLLFFAVQRQERALEVCKLLVDVHGVNAQQVDKRGQTALHWLACTQNVDCVKFLIEKRCAYTVHALCNPGSCSRRLAKSSAHSLCQKPQSSPVAACQH